MLAATAMNPKTKAVVVSTRSLMRCECTAALACSRIARGSVVSEWDLSSILVSFQCFLEGCFAVVNPGTHRAHAGVRDAGNVFIAELFEEAQHEHLTLL